VDVNQATLQHNKYKNIFALGDAANLPTAKTAAGIMS
jgi:sulfide:quinone oxidoreductase